MAHDVTFDVSYGLVACCPHVVVNGNETCHSAGGRVGRVTVVMEYFRQSNEIVSHVIGNIHCSALPCELFEQEFL